jgi:hypothetical protein
MKERPGDMSYGLYSVSQSNGPWAEISRTGGARSLTSSTTALPVNVWTHVAATYDGSQLRVYVNAVQVASVAATGNILASTGAMRIGGNTIWANEWFHGIIDEVRIYNRALSPSELEADMAAPIAP